MVRIFIHRIRKKLGRKVIINQSGRGYRLGELP